MGLFTTVYGEVAPHGEVDIQFRGGNDTLQTYRVGDLVGWEVNSHRVGDTHLIDGVYLGLFDVPSGTQPMRFYGHGGENLYRDAYVVIQGHHVVAVGELPEDSDERDNVLAEVYARHTPFFEDIRSLYTPEALARHEAEQQRYARENQERQARYAAMTPDERDQALREAIIAPLATQLNYQSIGRRLLQLTEPS